MTKKKTEKVYKSGAEVVADERRKRARTENRKNFAMGFVTLIVAAFLLFTAGKEILTRLASPEDEMLDPDYVVDPDEGDGTDITDESDYFNLETLDEGDIIYQGIVATLVNNDVPFFKSVEEIDEDNVIAVGAWEAMKRPKYANTLIYGEDTVSVLQSSVEEMAKIYFDYDKKFDHHSVSLFTEMVYDGTSGTYSMSMQHLDKDMYLPRIVKITEVDDQVILHVDYILTSEQSEYEEEGGELPQSHKSAEVVLSGDPPDYRVISFTEK